MQQLIFRIIPALILLNVSAALPVWGQGWCGSQPIEAPYSQIYRPVFPREPVTIPVVVHIVWRTPEENITDDIIIDQIKALNEDFRALNTNLNLLPTVFKELIGDTGINFCLAARTPDDNPTTGIPRQQTAEVAIGRPGNRDNFGNNKIYNSFAGGADAWDTERYLNIWVADMGSDLNGSATFPADAKYGEDGVIISNKAFGRYSDGSKNAPYHLGRTLTHEVGHYFNLLHPWGPKAENRDCKEDDGVSDTPVQSGTYQGLCPGSGQLSCGNLDLFQNFMNYTNDACLSMFTKGQVQRMQAALMGPRAGLLQSLGCEDPNASSDHLTVRNVKIWPNPVSDKLIIDFFRSSIYFRQVRCWNLEGKLLATYTIPGHQMRYEWDISGNTLKPGMYLLTITTHERTDYHKFVLQ